MSRNHYRDYDEETTARCERTLVTLLGDVGPWGNRIYLVGGLAPRYIVGSLPEEASTKFGAFNVRGAQLIAKDFTEHSLEADRLDDGGRSRVTVRVANILSYTVLKILAFQDRHENKDAYDLIYCLLNFGDGPEDAGRTAANSAICGTAQVQDAMLLLAQRFAVADNDGPHAYANFLAEGSDRDEPARLRQEAVAVVRAFFAAAGF